VTAESDNPRTILVVEDDRDTRDVVAELLREEGYSVTTAENGRLALDRLRHGDLPALILLDLRMPVLDGWTFLDVQRDVPGIAAVPVLIFSTVEAVDTRKYPTVRGWIPKLTDVAGLLDIVHRQLSPSGALRSWQSVSA
jgi:two-component system chemotaxis response regulator CheY